MIFVRRALAEVCTVPVLLVNYAAIIHVSQNISISVSRHNVQYHGSRY